MPWAGAGYDAASKKLTQEFKPAGLKTAVGFQTIQWASFAQTFASAIASKTGPAVSSGGGFQAYQYADQGAIAYADDLYASLKKDGTFADFLPGVTESFKTGDGYVAVPTQIDMRVWWWRKSILDAAGLSIPTTWDELHTVATTLAKKGKFSFGTGAGSGNAYGPHSVLTMMINNGGGLYAEDGSLDVVTTRNIEAVDFLIDLVKEGAIDTAAVGYTSDNLLSQWKNGSIAGGVYDGTLALQVADPKGDIVVGEPLKALHGDVATLQFLNNIMMYTNTPSQAVSEQFVSYFIQHMSIFWKSGVLPYVPVLKSIVDLPEYQADAQQAKIAKVWQPGAKTYGAQSDTISATVAKIDGGQAITAFTQSVISGGVASKVALAKLESDIGSL